MRDVRLNAAITQAELAERAKVTRPSVSLIENGRPARATTQRRLAEALGVDPSDLVETAVEALEHRLLDFTTTAR